MNNQKHFEIIRILDPLNKLFKPLPDSALKLYLEKLEKHDLNDIRRAVNDLMDTWDKSTFPPLAAFQKSLQTGVKSTAQSTTGKRYSWQERASKIRKAVSDFMHYFVKSPIYAEAESGGWENPLRRYAVEIAFVQAQTIHGGNIGYSSHDLCLAGDAESMLDEQDRVTKNGQINVTIPQKHIDYWKSIYRKKAA
jgi:hypothetical protein